jgi:hypothetical protein
LKKVGFFLLWFDYQGFKFRFFSSFRALQTKQPFEKAFRTRDTKVGAALGKQRKGR